MRTRSRSLARLAHLAARPCCRLVVVVVLRTPPAELSDGRGCASRPTAHFDRHELGGALDSTRVAAWRTETGRKSFSEADSKNLREYIVSSIFQTTGKRQLVFPGFTSPPPSLQIPRCVSFWVRSEERRKRKKGEGIYIADTSKPPPFDSCSEMNPRDELT